MSYDPNRFSADKKSEASRLVCGGLKNRKFLMDYICGRL